MKRVLLSVLLIALLGPFALHAQINQASEFMGAGKYAEAVEILESARSKGTAVLADQINLAYCYIMLHEYTKAEEVYAVVVQDKKADPRQMYLYGEVLRINRKYSDAKHWYQQYQALNPNDFNTAVRIRACDSLAVWATQNTNITVENAGDINTTFDELWPVPDSKGLYYISNNKGLLAQTGAVTGFSEPQLSFIYQRSAGNVSIYRPFSDSVTYPCFSSSEGKHAVVIKTIRKTADGEKLGNSVIMLGANNGGWSVFVPEDLPDGYVITHPCYANKGNRIYFASNIPGGSGGSDLYYSDFSAGKWLKAVNLGSAVNTAGDEMFPYVSGDGSTLYFASDGHPGYGNLDIFRCVLTGGQWSAPQNVRAPLNSIGNDFGLIFGDDPYRGYFVSNRHGASKGGNDIFAFHLPEPVIVPDTVHPPVVQVVPGDTNLVYFKTASAVIDPLFDAALNDIAASMKKMPYLKLNIETSADSRGTETFNTQLCAQRTTAVTDYLVKQGIDARRITGKSLGVTQTPDTRLIRYHVQIGYMPTDGSISDFQRSIRNETTVSYLRSGNGYCYYIGEGSLSEMKQLRTHLKTKYNIDGLLTASYGSYYLTELHYAPCRKATLYFSK